MDFHLDFFGSFFVVVVAHLFTSSLFYWVFGFCVSLVCSLMFGYRQRRRRRLYFMPVKEKGSTAWHIKLVIKTDKKENAATKRTQELERKWKNGSKRKMTLR